MLLVELKVPRDPVWSRTNHTGRWLWPCTT